MNEETANRILEFPRTPHVGRNSLRDDYATPWELYNPLARFYQFDIDCAAGEENAKTGIYYSEQNSFLTADAGEFSNKRCWLNPPFSLKEKFLERVVGLRNIASLFACLVANNGRETEWWQQWVWPHADEIISLTPRVNYLLDGTLVKGVAFPSCLIIYRPRLSATYGAPREIIYRWTED